MPKKTPQKNPETFRDFIRELGVRAFDQLAARAAGKERERRRSGSTKKNAPGAMIRLTTYWSGMNESEKEQFFDQMISEAQAVAADQPVSAASSRGKKSGGRKKKTSSS